MDGINCLQDIFLTSKLVHTSVIVLGQELLRPFNVLTMEKQSDQEFLQPLVEGRKSTWSVQSF